MQTKETRGLVLYNRQFREDDKLVKIFTETSGKHMFFVRHATNSKLSSVIQPLILANFILKINNHGLSYIEDYKGVSLFKEINADIYKLAYATYLVSLADAAISDAVYDAPLFAFLIKTLELMDEGLDYEILTNIFEIQILDRFGVQLNFHDCVFCHRVGLAFDFSHRYSGLLCPEHYEKDPYRSHLDPNVPYLLNQFQTLHFDSLKTISVKPDMKQKLRKFIDEVYEDYIGLRLKSKKFIDDLDHWGQVMK
ncbi:DNA repair protein RecO [Streptococcus mutans]|jgi:DNA repair protein recO|uniref:DNA repair protein RecO n=1 Tax=Streptococcus mutans SM6 TaxID=857119 RepID=A0A829BHZ2_STRMG|nr:DNA repair protein RecO [Streptococcus mutans]EMB69321.1 DNA repair protein RecO [Streptococcus mutans 11SSST2]EMB75894.1 DNA repair protein RecO [Streptococcus mutans 2VS1]EMB94391.1 DNA repair protein RecO [Streptococcus mutans G123]EMB98327.1 DNA repair protein RecO [Streptococcus mutans T4]EMC05728.1 DNA repair protein RecO [Streptococcus mutans NLML4]